MKKMILLLTLISSLCFLCITCNAQSPNWLWVKSVGGLSNDEALSVTSDVNNNIIVVGDFQDPVISFDSVNLTNNGFGGNDILIVKYDTSGSVLWAKCVGGISNDDATSVTTDVNGNILVTGAFCSPTINFDSITLTNSGSWDIFLAKYNSSGKILWAKCAGGNDHDMSNSVTTDNNGNVLITGGFKSNIISFDSVSLTNISSGPNAFDMFLAKYSSSGNLLWVKRAGGTDYDIANSVATDSYGNIIVTGEFNNSSISFDSITLTNSGSSLIFVAKYNPAGKVIWAKQSICSGIGIHYAYSITTDSNDNILIAGYFGGTMICFDMDTLINIGAYDIFLIKYSSTGNVLWAKSAGSGSFDVAYSVATDLSDNIYIAGQFYNYPLVFGQFILPDIGDGDIFITKFDNAGNIIWAKSAGGTNYDEQHSIKIDNEGNIYIVGDYYSKSISFDSILLNNVDTTGNSHDIFIAKIDNKIITGLNEFSNTLNISLFPNPSTDNITIITPKKSEIEILNLQGQIIKRIKADQDKTTIDISAFATGMYFIKVTTEKEIIIKKFIKE